MSFVKTVLNLSDLLSDRHSLLLMDEPIDV